MNRDKWTKQRKALCEEFWDHCAQEELYCKMGLGNPCKMVLDAERDVNLYSIKVNT